MSIPKPWTRTSHAAYTVLISEAIQHELSGNDKRAQECRELAERIKRDYLQGMRGVRPLTGRDRWR